MPPERAELLLVCRQLAQNLIFAFHTSVAADRVALDQRKELKVFQAELEIGILPRFFELPLYPACVDRLVLTR